MSAAHREGHEFPVEMTIPEARYSGQKADEVVLREQDIVGAMEFFTSELRVRDRSVTAALATVGEQVGELLGPLEDRQALLTRLARLALTDQLTGCPTAAPGRVSSAPPTFSPALAARSSRR